MLVWVNRFRFKLYAHVHVKQSVCSIENVRYLRKSTPHYVGTAPHTLAHCITTHIAMAGWKKMHELWNDRYGAGVVMKSVHFASFYFIQWSAYWWTTTVTVANGGRVRSTHMPQYLECCVCFCLICADNIVICEIVSPSLLPFSDYHHHTFARIAHQTSN